MDNFLISIASLIVAIIATIWVSNYYFRRSRRKELTPFIQFCTSVFRGVDPSVRESLKIVYKDTPITDLFEIQFLVANTGERAIRDLIRPLTMETPESASILDASILHIHPQGRDVSIETFGTHVIFHFPLLNSNEYFIAKFLLQGNPNPRQFRFIISADDLPPALEPRFLHPSLVKSSVRRDFESGLLTSGIVMLLFGASLAGLIYPNLPLISQMWSVGFVETFKANWIILTSCFISAIPALLLLIFGLIMIVGAFADFSFPRQTRFHVPSDYIRDPFRRHRSEIDYFAAMADGDGEPVYPLPDPKRRAQEHL